MNKYFCSNGETVSESTIKKRLSDAYKKWYEEGTPNCAGCGKRAIETSHIIAKARCKELHHTELIWYKPNTFPSCRICHQKFEALDNPAWCELMNVDACLEVLEKFDKESYNKRLIIYEQFMQNTSFTFHAQDRSATVAAILSGNSLKFGLAMKSEKDNFSRKLGRRIALGRASVRPYAVTEVNIGDDLRQVFHKNVPVLIEKKKKELSAR